MAGYLIKDTTREEREQIVAESLGYMEANCDGCSSGLAEMYQAYIDGEKELRTLIWSFMQDMSRGRKYRGEDPARCKDSKHKVSKFAKTLSIREKPEKRDADAEGSYNYSKSGKWKSTVGIQAAGRIFDGAAGD